MNAIAIILAIPSEEIPNDSVIEKWWQWSHISHAKSVAKHLFASSKFSVKIILSVNKDDKISRDMISCNCGEIITGVDFSLPETTKEHLRGLSAAFVITEMNYKSSKPLDDEVKIGRAIADSCLSAGVPYVIYSSLTHVSASFGIRSDVCDAKAHISDYMNKIGVSTTTLYIPFLYEDFLYGFMKPVQSNRPNTYKIVAATGHTPVDFLALDDIGKCVLGLLDQATSWIGKTVALSGDRMTIEEFATQITNITYPHIVNDGKVTPEEFAAMFDSAGSEDMANYFDFMTRSVQCNHLATTMSLNQEVIPFYDWLQLNKSTFLECFKQVVKTRCKT